MWEKRLAHERCVRDAHVACGNQAPLQADPPNGLIRVAVRTFKGTVFFPFLESRGHDNAEFAACCCF